MGLCASVPTACAKASAQVPTSSDGRSAGGAQFSSLTTALCSRCQPKTRLEGMGEGWTSLHRPPVLTALRGGLSRWQEPQAAARTVGRVWPGMGVGTLQAGWKGPSDE